MSQRKETLLQEGDSPESRISPYEDLDTRQNRISGEKFPGVTLGLCDKCHWCYTSISNRGLINVCPVCRGKVSQIPMTLEEVCRLEIDSRGVRMEFTRKLPVR